MQLKLSYFLALPLFAFILVAAVGSASAQQAELAGTSWKLTSIQSPTSGTKSTSDQNITLSFDSKGNVGGQSTCNSYNGSYTAGDDGSLAITQVISTLRACVDNALMDLEAEYYAALNDVTSYALNGDTLVLTSADGGTLTFESANATVGMPQTGASFGFADAAPFAVLGVSLVLLGAGFLFWRRASQV